MMDPNSGRPLDTVRMNRQQKQQLIDAMESGNPSGTLRERRTLRVPMSPTQGKVVVAVTHPSGYKAKYAVLPRNLSRKGMAFIHGQFLYPGSACDVVMQDLEGQWWQLTGKVVRCRHVRGVVHEASVVFDDVAELDRFVALTPEQRSRDQEDTKRLSSDGSEMKVGKPILMIEPNGGDRKLLRHYLGQLGLEVETATTLNMALRMIRRADVALALVNIDMYGGDAMALLSELRGGGMYDPIIAMSSHNDSRHEAEAMNAGANAFLAKPFDPQQLARLVSKMLGLDLVGPGGGGAG